MSYTSTCTHCKKRGIWKQQRNSLLNQDKYSNSKSTKSNPGVIPLSTISSNCKPLLSEIFHFFPCFSINVLALTRWRSLWLSAGAFAASLSQRERDWLGPQLSTCFSSCTCAAIISPRLCETPDLCIPSFLSPPPFTHVRPHGSNN